MNDASRDTLNKLKEVSDTLRVLLLNEDSHPLITPQFNGTAEEVTQALRSWSDIIENLRFLDTRVTAYDNRSKIIQHLKRELDVLLADLGNKSADLAPTSDIPTMAQPVDNDASVDVQVAVSDEDVDLSPIAAAEKPAKPAPPTPQEAAAAHAAKYAAVTTAPSAGLGSLIGKHNASR